MAGQTVIALATYGYLVRMVGAVQVGAWVSLMAAGMLACIADLGLNHALIRQLSVALQDGPGAVGERALEIIETIVATVAVATGVTLLLVWLTYPWWAGLLTKPADAAHSQHWPAFVMAGLWLNRLGEALAGALDGQQRFVERSLASVAAQMCGLALTVALVPRWGMPGFGVAFVVQNLLLVALLGWHLARLRLGLCWWRPRFRPAVLREALRYGLSVQLLVMCYLVIESGVKLSLARSGNLAEVAYFDLAFRIGRGVRGLLASALRVLVPRLAPAANDAGGLQWRHQAYAKSFAALQLFALPIFTAILAASQLLSSVLVGRSEPVFVAALGASLAAWLGYSLTDPAMNLSLASGRMRWPVLGHVLTLVLTLIAVVVGWPESRGSPTLGLYMVVTLAILGGCVTTLVGVHHSEGAGWQLLRPLQTMAALVAAAVIGWSGAHIGTLLPTWSALARWAAVAAMLAAFVAWLWLSNPVGRQIGRSILPRLLRRPGADHRPAGG